MPYISFKTNHKLTLRQENTIKSKSGELISLIPGKTEKALMIHMEDDQIMYFIRGNWDVCFYLSLPDAAAKRVFLPIIPLRVNVWE